jgi:hypothetical protein
MKDPISLAFAAIIRKQIHALSLTQEERSEMAYRVLLPAIIILYFV